MKKQLALMFGIWLFVYPIVTAILYALRTFGSSLPVPVQTLIATLILVPVMIGWVAPFVRKQVGVTTENGKNRTLRILDWP